MKFIFLIASAIFTSQLSLAAIQTPSPERDKVEANQTDQSFHGRKAQERKRGPVLMINENKDVPPGAGWPADGEAVRDSTAKPERESSNGINSMNQRMVTPRSFKAENRHDGERYDEARLNRLQNWILRLHEDVRNSANAADQKKLNSLDGQVKAAQDLLNSLKTSRTEDWENLHNQFNNLIVRLTADYEKTKKRD